MNALLSDIKRGRQLKKVVVEEKKAKEPETLGGFSVAGILARRAALDGDESESSSDDGEWDD